MQTLKTALVVTFLLAVLYGVFVTLNQPEPASEADHFDTVEWDASQMELPPFGSEGQGTADTAAGPPPLGKPSTDFQVPDFPGHTAHSGSPEPVDLASAYNAEVDSPPSSPSGLPSVGPPRTDIANPPAADPGAPSYGAEVTAGASDNGSHRTADTSPPANPYETSPYANAGNTAGEATDDQYVEATPGFEPNDADPAAADDTDAQSQAKLAEYNFREAWAAAQDHVDANDYAYALAELTQVYREQGLPAEKRTQLLEMLDQLAGSVIYSTEHRLESPYTVSRGETLEQIAQAYKVPPLLLYNINRNSISEPDLLLPGTQLKVLEGPFRAEIEIDPDDPSRGEATLFLHTLYAGRFPVSFASDLPKPGRTYQVTERLPGKTFYPPSGRPLEAGAPGNPYGAHWIGLNDPAVGLHGGEASDPRGSIRLSNRDAADVYGILSVGSMVKILQ